MSSAQHLLSVLTGSEAQEFLKKHASDKPEACLNAAIKIFGTEAKFVLEQLHLQQKAIKKLPGLQTKGWFLSTKSYEQCTPEAVARFKAGLYKGSRFTDLCAGAGIDAWFAAEKGMSLQLVEADEKHAELLTYNFRQQPDCRIYRAKAENILNSLTRGGCVYLDPDRRAEGKRVFDFSASQPDVTQLLPQLLQQYEQIFIKGSPMLDISACLQQLPHTKKLYAICWQAELKELLFELEPGFEGQAQLHAVLLDSHGHVSDHFSGPNDQKPNIRLPLAGEFLYEPHAALIKTRLDRAHAAELQLSAINAHAAWYVSDKLLADFPGRCWRIEAILPYKPKTLKQQLQRMGITRAHLSKRDFGLEVAEIRKRLGIAEGEDAHLCFTKNPSGDALCLVCKKA